MNWFSEKNTLTKYTRYIFEFLFALNVGLVTRWVTAQANYYDSELKTQIWLTAHLHLHPHSQMAGRIAFLLLALEITLFVFLALRALVYFFPLNALFRWVGGLGSLLALPLGWLYVTRTIPTMPGQPSLPRVWLLGELIAVSIWAVFYVRSTLRPATMWTGVAVIIFHFGLWAWLFPIGVPWLDPFWSVFPLAGLTSSLVWLLYLRQRPSASDTYTPARSSTDPGRVASD